MRICHITINKIELERRVLNQIETAKRIGFKVITVSLGKPGEKSKERKGGFLIKRIFTKYHTGGPIKFLIFNLKVFLYILFRPIQVIHCHDLWPLPAAALASLLKNSYLIYDAHEYYGGLNIFRKRPIRKHIWMTLEWLSIPLVDTLISISEPLGELYQKRYTQLKKIKNIRNVPKFEKLKKVEKFSSNQFEHTVIFHGHFKPGRGLENLIHAMTALPNIRLVLVGGGELHERLLQLVDSLKLNNVEFLDYIEQSQLISHAAKADLGIVLFEPTSLNYSFALPNKFFEYMMAGLPILASNILTFDYYVEKYDIGKTVDPSDINAIANTIETMLSYPQDLIRWKENCLNLAKEVCWEKESIKLKEIYSEFKS